jgi:hypothetical protein
VSKPGPVGGRDVGFRFSVYHTMSRSLMMTEGSRERKLGMSLEEGNRMSKVTGTLVDPQTGELAREHTGIKY